ncbi:MAG: hypothetical protein QM779_10255 [Propionicimonas sp.]|uniref:hypothetical protein n=1 Tax=Propionicimonas sp. TaxID=1955623 RepID=UPI003D135E54
MDEFEQEIRDSLSRASGVEIAAAPLDADEIARRAATWRARPRVARSVRPWLAAAAAVALLAGTALGVVVWLGGGRTVPAVPAPVATPAASGDRVVVELYSGRENPEVALDAGVADELYRMLADQEAAGLLEPGDAPTSDLGFAGLLVVPADTSRPSLRVLPTAVYLEQDGRPSRLDDPDGNFYSRVYDAIRPLLEDSVRQALPDTDPAVPTVTATVPPQRGVTATWVLAEPQKLTAGSTTVVIDVTRLECSGGRTGELLEPVVSVAAGEVIIRVDAVPLGAGLRTCPGNDAVEVAVGLPEPLGDRRLVDAACLEGDAVRTSACSAGAVRWKP